jgi:hypothetical protein
MKLTNKYNMPDFFYRAVAAPWYKGGQYNKKTFCSATTLLKPAYMWALQKKLYADGIELEEDASDSIWRVMGSACHEIIEKVNSPPGIFGKIFNFITRQKYRYIVEKKIEFDIDNDIISGRCDVYDKTDKAIWDLKITSVWKGVFKEFDEYEEQLNIYAYGLRRMGLEISSINVLLLYRDWSKTKINDGNYPQKNFDIFELKLWGNTDCVNFIEEKIKQKKFMMKNLDLISCCKFKERWQDKKPFAIKKEGQKKAVKLFENKADALTYMNELTNGAGEKYNIEERLQDKRCRNYCIVNEHCKYYKEKYL